MARKQLKVPTMTMTLTKGPIDLLSIQIGNKSVEYNAYITLMNSSGRNIIGPIRSSQGVIDRCLTGVENIKLEFSGLSISTSQQSIQIELKTCEHTLRKSSSY